MTFKKFLRMFQEHKYNPTCRRLGSVNSTHTGWIHWKWNIYMESEIKYILEHDMIEPSNSKWSLPYILKPYGSYRSVLIFVYWILWPWKIFSIPRIDDCIEKIGCAKYVSKLKGYWLVPLTRRDQRLSAFVTPTQLYQYKVMPFGMKNAPATFQQLIQQLTSDLVGCEGYIDDVVIYSTSIVSFSVDCHKQILLSTWVWALSDNTFGTFCGPGKDSPAMAKVEAVAIFLNPVTKKFMRLLGIAGYYWKFCHIFSVIVAPPTNLLKKNNNLMCGPQGHD